LPELSHGSSVCGRESEWSSSVELSNLRPDFCLRYGFDSLAPQASFSAFQSFESNRCTYLATSRFEAAASNFESASCAEPTSGNSAASGNFAAPDTQSPDAAAGITAKYRRMGYVRSTYFEHVYDEYFHQESEFLFSKVDASTEEIIKPMVDSDRDSGTVDGIASGSGRVHCMVLRR
jgi:hypothetical protein